MLEYIVQRMLDNPKLAKATGQYEYVLLYILMVWWFKRTSKSTFALTDIKLKSIAKYIARLVMIPISKNSS